MSTRARQFAKVKGDSPVAYARAGAEAYAAGDVAGALGAYLMALALAPKNAVYRRNAIHLIGITGGYKLPPALRQVLGEAAADPATNCQPLANAVASFIEGDPLCMLLAEQARAGGAALEAAIASGQFDEIFSDGLTIAVMQRAVIVSPVFETVMTALRRHILVSVMQGAPSSLLANHLPFCAALAAQCFNTEYAYAVSEDEAALLPQLLAQLTEWPPAALALVGAYRPLHEVLEEAPVDAQQSPEIAFLLRQQLAEPAREAELMADLVEVTPIDDAFSARMQAQYESYPYPRWFAVEESGARPFAQIMAERFPHLNAKALPKYNPEVLIAGCGTGQQIAQVAATFKSPRITAVDLSRTSLAYAARKMEERGIRTKSFGQADILALDDGEERFDYIECMGVLHHMADPMAGLKVLTGLLHPHGIMRLALYSERARQDVVEARRWIAEEGLEDSREGVRLARQKIAALSKGHVMRSIMENQDFYSISGLHDLIFNVHEYRYTPLQLRDMLAEAGLDFLGFDHIDPGIGARYAAFNPVDPQQTDLAAWDRFEAENPDIFSNMLQFWCRRRQA